MITTIKNGLNICFLNSIIQMLMSKDDFILDKPEYENLRQLYKKGGIISSITFLNYYRSLHSDYVVGTMHDSVETLGYILDDITDKSKFQIKYKQKITRPEEILENEMSENIMCVSIKDSMQESINNFFKKEEPEQYEVNGEIRSSPLIEFFPLNTPQYLFISLKRFNPLNSTKDSREVNVEEIINYNGEKYKCVSFIIHIGTIQVGHYITCSYSNKWILYDDESYNDNITNEESLKLQRISYIFMYELIEIIDLT